jgi:hypothetical protein
MAKSLRRQQAKGGRVIQAPPEDYSSWNLSFTFHATQPGFGVLDLSNDEKVEFMEAMDTRSHMTWSQMYGPHRGLGVHAIAADRFKVAVPAFLKDKTILSIYCGKGLRRLVGHRVHATFCVVWFDPNGKTYPHGD